MKVAAVYKGRLVAALQSCQEEGQAAAARGEAIETCPYKHPAKVAAWQRGHLLHSRQEFNQPAGTVAVKRDLPQIATVRALLKYTPDSGEPGWWRYGQGVVAHWFAKPGQRSMCGGEYQDYAWVRDGSAAWCIACWRELEFRRAWATLPPPSPARRAELEAQLKELMK